MVQYSSRVGSSGGATTKTAGKPPKKKKPIPGKGGDLAIGGKGLSGAGLISGGDLVVGVLEKASIPKNESASNTGGSIPKSVEKKIDKAIEVASKVSSAVSKVASESKRLGSLSKEKATEGLKKLVDRLTHNGMTQVLQHMNPVEFHSLQGIAGAHLPQFNAHPMAGIAKQVLGGSFTHPRDISKIATRDIMRAITAQQLSVAMHMEMMDNHKGIPVGGGLLSSLKYHFKRGIDGFKSKLKSGLQFGQKMQGALKRGIELGQAFSPIVNALFPGAGALLSAGLTGAKLLQAGLEKGVKVGEKIESGIESISPDVGDEPTSGAPSEPVTTALQGLIDQPPQFDAPLPPMLSTQDNLALGFQA